MFTSEVRSSTPWVIEIYQCRDANRCLIPHERRLVTETLLLGLIGIHDQSLEGKCEESQQRPSCKLSYRVLK